MQACPQACVAVVTLALCASVGCAGGDGEFGSSPGSASFGTATSTASSTAPSPTTAGSTTPGTSGTGGSSTSVTSTNPATTNETTPDPTSGTQSTAGSDETGPPVACTLAADCDDADACTEDNCVNAFCENTPRNCDDTIDCTADSCNPATGICENVPTDSTCDNLDACDGVESCDPVLGCTPGESVICQDPDACTADTCDPMTGQCSFDPIAACVAADGCCPGGCSAQADNDCVCTNLAPSATPTSSGGGAGTYGPTAWTDGVDEDGCSNCLGGCFGWILNTPSSNDAFMQLTWASDVTIGSIHLDTTAPGGNCNSSGRYMASGRVQWWNGAAWVDSTTWSNATADLSFDFDPPLVTSRIRLQDVRAPAGGSNSLMFEWSVYQPLGCMP